MTDEPCIKRELESPTPKRQRLSVSSAQDMFDLMHQYSPPPPPPPPPGPNSGSGGNGPPSGAPHLRRRPAYNNHHRWSNDHRNNSPRSPMASRRSPYPANGGHLRRSPHHGLRRSNRHRQGGGGPGGAGNGGNSHGRDNMEVSLLSLWLFFYQKMDSKCSRIELKSAETLFGL